MLILITTYQSITRALIIKISYDHKRTDLRAIIRRTDLQINYIHIMKINNI